ncbi:hypothetical protein AVEN_263782-1 [Araneus ventricosus]|uniref:Uncharacterized protein n=1 Tax=Araneus ventricosus TaxID=182803 RepID=A0A4Y2GGB2_ARAVE|nr:hypothetical protein AVEN_263782-1 [Araneus ventricosus]
MTSDIIRGISENELENLFSCTFWGKGCGCGFINPPDLCFCFLEPVSRYHPKCLPRTFLSGTKSEETLSCAFSCGATGRVLHTLMDFDTFELS